MSESNMKYASTIVARRVEKAAEMYPPSNAVFIVKVKKCGVKRRENDAMH
jgi:hypothetical protein